MDRCHRLDPWLLRFHNLEVLCYLPARHQHFSSPKRRGHYVLCHRDPQENKQRVAMVYGTPHATACQDLFTRRRSVTALTRQNRLTPNRRTTASAHLPTDLQAFKHRSLGAYHSLVSRCQYNLENLRSAARLLRHLLEHR